MAKEISDTGGGTQLIARIAAVLEALGAQPEGMSLSQIASATSLPRSTVQRLVHGLAGQGLVGTGIRGIHLGPAITRLAAASRVDVVAAAIPFIEAAGKRARETVDLSLFRAEHVLLVYQYQSDHELRVISPVGSALPTHCTAHGKALLARLNNDEVRALLRRPMDRLTPHTITEMQALLAELDRIRQQGFALDMEEHAPGVCGIGVAIHSSGAEKHAVSIAVPALRFEASLEVLKATLFRCKAEIEAAVVA